MLSTLLSIASFRSDEDTVEPLHWFQESQTWKEVICHPEQPLPLVQGDTDGQRVPLGGLTGQEHASLRRDQP